MRLSASFISMSCALLSSVGSAEPLIFHSQRHAGDLTIRLSLIDNVASVEAGYDYDVRIRTEETKGGGKPYADPSGHKVSVRCTAPEAVAVAGIDYPIGSPASTTGNWKEDLWRAVCRASVS